MRDHGHGTICRSPCEHQQPSPGSSRPLNTSFALLLSDLLNIINHGSFISLMPLQFGQIFHQLLSLSCEPLLQVVTVFMYRALVIFFKNNVTALYKLSYLIIKKSVCVCVCIYVYVRSSLCKCVYNIARCPCLEWSCTRTVCQSVSMYYYTDVSSSINKP